MASSQDMTTMIKGICYVSNNVVVINGAKYLVEDITRNIVILEDAEYHFATVHETSGKLKMIIYYHLHSDTIIHYYLPPTMTHVPSGDVIELCEFILAVPNLEGLFDGDLDVIARVKNVIDTFHIRKQLFYDVMMECANSTTYHKACRN